MTIQEEYDEGRRNFSYMRLEHAFLRGANLSGADFTHTDLTDAMFTDADLTDANFMNTRLINTIFKRVTLTNADFRGADLNGAILVSTNFTGVNLTDADFGGTHLRDIIFTRATLTRTCFDPEASIPTLTDEEILAAGLEMDGEWVYGWRTEWSSIKQEKYVPCKEPYVAPVFSVSQNTPCHPGIYLADRKWLVREYGKYVPVVRCRCKRYELIHAGDQWRAKRLWIEEER